MKLIKSLVICVMAVIASCMWIGHITASDEYIRARVVMIRSKVGVCTGTAIMARSGRMYTLTAAHCVDILVNGQAEAVRENGSVFKVTMVARDAVHDLMLLTSEEKIGLRMAVSTSRHEKVHAITHGKMHDSYRTDGETMEEIHVEIPMSAVNSNKDARECLKTSNHYIADSLFGKLCIAKMVERMSTLPVLPGSSGGAVLNADGEIVGVVSASESDGLSLIIPFRFVQAFLAKY